MFYNYFFCICSARSSEGWTPSNANCKLNDSSKEICNSPSSMSCLQQTTKAVLNAKSICPAGFNNKINTCYTNSIWQRWNYYAYSLEENPFQIKPFIFYFTCYHFQCDCKKEFNQTHWFIFFKDLKHTLEAYH